MTRHGAPRALVAGMVLAMIGIGIASLGVLGAIGAIPLSSLSPAAPSLDLSVYTNVAPGSQNTLHVSLINVADPGGELVRVSIDGGPEITLAIAALDTAPAAPRGSAQLKFDSGSAGSHTVNVRWSNATHDASSTVRYNVVASGLNPSEHHSGTGGTSLLSVILCLAGGAMAVSGYALMRRWG